MDTPSLLSYFTKQHPIPGWTSTNSVKPPVTMGHKEELTELFKNTTNIPSDESMRMPFMKGEALEAYKLQYVESCECSGTKQDRPVRR